MSGEPPFTIGWDIADTVDAVGPGVSAFAPGRGPRHARPPGGQATPTPSTPSPPSARSSTSPPSSPPSKRPASDGRRHGLTPSCGRRRPPAVQIAKSQGVHVLGTASAGKHALLRRLCKPHRLSSEATLRAFDQASDTYLRESARSEAPAHAGGVSPGIGAIVGQGMAWLSSVRPRESGSYLFRLSGERP